MVQLHLQPCDSYLREMKIEDTSGKQIYKKTFTDPAEADQFLAKYCRPKADWEICKAVIFPIRTSLKDFYKDLFLPTVVNRALAVSGIAKKIFAVIGAIMLDIVTLPIRPFTFLLRAYQNRHQEPHPLYKYLVDQNVPAESLGNGKLILKFNEIATVEYVNDDSLDPSIGDSFLKETRSKDENINLFIYKYNCLSDGMAREPESLTVWSPMKQATHKILRVESIERDLKWKDMPDATWYIKGGVKTVLYKKVQDQWEQAGPGTIFSINLTHYSY